MCGRGPLPQPPTPASPVLIMLVFLSPEWIAALDATARQWEGPSDMDLTLALEIRGGGADVDYHLTLAGGELRVRSGRPVSTPTITLRQSYGAAAEIAQGRINAQQALAAGHLKVSGDIASLARNGRALAALGDVFGRLRDRTVY